MKCTFVPLYVSIATLYFSLYGTGSHWIVNVIGVWDSPAFGVLWKDGLRCFGPLSDYECLFWWYRITEHCKCRLADIYYIIILGSRNCKMGIVRMKMMIHVLHVVRKLKIILGLAPNIAVHHTSKICVLSPIILLQDNVMRSIDLCLSSW